MTHTERVHVYFGAGLCLMGLLALAAARWPRSRAGSLWPILTFALGFLLFVPVEAGTRTYEDVPWGRTALSWIPDDVGRWGQDWFAFAGQRHVIQHKMAGLFAMAFGAIAFGIVRGRLTARAWPRLLPWLSIGFGLALGVHGGSPHHLSSLGERIHHWILGAGFVVVGILLFFEQRGLLRGAGWKYAWPSAVVLIGLNMVLFYRVSSMAAGH